LRTCRLVCTAPKPLATSCSSARRHSVGYCFVLDCERECVNAASLLRCARQSTSTRRDPLLSARESIRAESAWRLGRRDKEVRDRTPKFEHLRRREWLLRRARAIGPDMPVHSTTGESGSLEQDCDQLRASCKRADSEPATARSPQDNHLANRTLDYKLDPTAGWCRIAQAAEICLFAGASLSGRQDLNLRPPGPQPGALPDCATPRGCGRPAGRRGPHVTHLTQPGRRQGAGHLGWAREARPATRPRDRRGPAIYSA
jgi:hypothetical protein